jgi:phosphatidylserine/phosphatidylglycerophosphate/cardiolipin synthase-like enzyme
MKTRTALILSTTMNMAALNVFHDVEDVEETIWDEGDEAVRAVENSLKNASPKTKQKLTGWCIPQMTNYHDGVDISDGRRYFCQPREADQQPSDTPKDHPLRAIAAVMEAAPNESLIRVYAYSLTDPYFLDLIIHHCKAKPTHVILEPNELSINMIKRICSAFDAAKAGNSEPAKSILQSTNIKFRVANCNLHYPETSMHMKGIITDKWTILGSYNFSLDARCKNWEQLLCVHSQQVDTVWFDAIWGNLINREIDLWDYDASLFRKQPKRPYISMSTSSVS